ncbi:ATP-binding cassette domain-containing protein [Mangrovivirga sp. M17]|uniref:ATP-binding cassette domain-containing protein n=1 Tax=Mangrovivirga halotolerans TaxID=2993936 RepID=A0ABT3RNX7_9BACT|nr:ATP-binding cassette domain-containing protein [Mangrovivirga halotolerans]MCX2743064.1 ATP-binding cassette domain-containing protein [Mangrovivirga halotolerans]
MKDNIVVEAENIKKSFGDNVVIKDISFNLKELEHLAVMGRSGSGKSVLIKSLVGLIVPDSGKLNVLGENILDMDDDDIDVIRRQVGYLFQGGALYDSMTVERNMKFPLRRHPDKPSESEIKDLVDETLENVGLLETKKKYPSELSGGMKKRIALARTLIMRPKIMLYDEPTTGLDMITSAEISELILKMREEYDISSIIITHDVSCVELTSDRVIILGEGTSLAEGTFEELSNSEDKDIRSYFTMIHKKK